MTKKTGEILFVQMDEGSANVVQDLVEKEVNCGNAMALYQNGTFSSLRYGLYCRSKFATAQADDDPSKQQCVAMGGNVEGCPVYGRTSTGEAKGGHEQLRKLIALQKEIADALTYSVMGNFNTLSGSRFDKS